MSIDLGTAIGYLDLDLTNFKKGIGGAINDLNVFTDNTTSATDRLEALSSASIKIGSSFTKFLTLPIVGLGTAFAKITSDFDTGMSKVQAISGATGDDLESLRDKAKEMGAATKFSATESAEAFTYMAMAGWKTEDMLNGIEGVMNLAAASGEDLALTSDIVTDAITAFGLSAEDSSRFADVLAAASSNSNTNVAMMGETFKYVAPLAGAFGYTVEETAEQIGLMANAGVKSGQAGTALRQVFTRLNSATYENLVAMEDAKNATEGYSDSLSIMDRTAILASTGASELQALFGALGISATNADGSMRPLNDVMQDLRVSMDGMTESEQGYVAQTLAGQYAMSGFLAVINAAPEDIDKLRESIQNADGAAERMALIMQENLGGQLTILKSAAEGLAISFGEILVPMILSVVYALQDFINWINGFDESTKRIIVTVGLFVAALGPILLIVGKVIGVVTTVSGAFMLLRGQMVATTTAAEALKANIVTLQAVMKTLVNPFNLVLGAALLLIVALKDFEGPIEYLVIALESLAVGMVAFKVAVAIAPVLNAAKLALAGMTGAVNLHSIAVGIATAAQALWNAVTTANSIGLIAGAIAGATAGILLLAKALTRVTEETEKQVEENNKLVESNNNLVESVESANEAYKDSIDALKAETGSARSLSKEIQELAKNQNRSAGEQARMIELIDQLNVSVPGLALAYNEESDALNLTADQIEKYTQAHEAELMLSAQMEEQTRIRQDMVKAEVELAANREKQIEINNRLSGSENLSFGDKRALKSSLEELVTAEQALQETYDDSIVKYEILNGSIEENARIVDESSALVEEIQESTLSRTDAILKERADAEAELTRNMQAEADARGITLQEYEQQLDEAKAAQESYVDEVVNSFKRLTLETNQSFVDMADILLKNQNDIDSWRENLVKLTDAGLTDYVRIFETQGVEKTAGLTQEMVTAVESMQEKTGLSIQELIKDYDSLSPEIVSSLDASNLAILEKLVETQGIFKTEGEEAVNSYTTAIQDGTQGVIDSGVGMLQQTADAMQSDNSVETASRTTVIDSKSAFDSEVASLDFFSTGHNIVAGVQSGMLAGQSLVLQAAGQIAFIVKQKFSDDLGIQSPSRAFYELAEYINQGLAQGLYDSSGLPTQAMDNIAREILNSGNTISTGLINFDKETGQAMLDTTYDTMWKKIDIYFAERDARVDMMTSGTEETIRSLDNEVRATEQAHDIKMKLYEQEYNARIALLDAESSAAIAAIQAEIDAINKKKETERRQEEKSKYEEERRAQVEAMEALTEGSAEYLKAQEQLEKLDAQRSKTLKEQERQDTLAALREEINNIRQSTIEKKNQMKEEYEAKKAQLERQKADEIQMLAELQERLKADFEQRQELEELQTTIKKAEEDNKSVAEIEELKRREKELEKSLAVNTIEYQKFGADVKLLAYQAGNDFYDGLTVRKNDIFEFLRELKRLADIAKAAAIAARNEGAGGNFLPWGDYSNRLALSSGLDDAISMVRAGNTYSSFGEMLTIPSATNYDLDIERLGRVIAESVKPNITMQTEITAPNPLSERIIKRDQEQMLREMLFQYI